MSYLKVSRHTTAVKHRILLYYLKGCVYRAKLHNWGYIETHAASGICEDKKQKGFLIDGSPVIVHSAFPKIPMAICEIDEARFQVLNKRFARTENVKVLLGDSSLVVEGPKFHLGKEQPFLHRMSCCSEG